MGEAQGYAFPPPHSFRKETGNQCRVGDMRLRPMNTVVYHCSSHHSTSGCVSSNVLVDIVELGAVCVRAWRTSKSHNKHILMSCHSSNYLNLLHTLSATLPII